MEGRAQMITDLRNRITAELYTDPLQLGIYATDASNYQIMPLAVCLPKDENELKDLVKWASENKVPLLARGGGTSLVGQTVAQAVVIDFTKYMDRILEVNADEQWAWVQPGLVRDVLNKSLKSLKLHFAPDPATSSRATLGGMIANNSSGTRSILYGKTIDHVLELRVLLNDGSIIHCKSLKPAELETLLESDGREASLYRNLFGLIQKHREEILERFPRVMRRVGGYNLDEFLGEDWNLSKLITGSECTLGIILSAKIKLVPNPKYQSLCVVHFHDFFDSISHLQQMVKFNPASVELLDHLLLEKSRENLETRNYCRFINGDPQGVQVVEFYGDTKEEALQKATQLGHYLKEKGIGYSWPVLTDPIEIENVFTLRKKGLGLLMGVKGNRKPIAFIEDAAVPLEHLANYIREVFDVCHAHDTPVVAYAHASVGLLHVKPLLDLRDEADIQRMKAIGSKCLQLVKKYKGSWSGEHGDGLARSPYNEEFFGPTLYQAFQEVKRSFDPDGIMNPGKIVDAPPVDLNLRYGARYKDRDHKSMFHYRSEGSFKEAVHLCNGVGECRKQQGGTMCPSFRATKNEKDSTRGRANLLRLAMSSQLDNKGLDSPLLQEIMDLCLSCKACKSECPSNVDMAKLKSEINHIHKKKHGLTMADKLILQQTKMGMAFGGSKARVINAVLRNKMFRKLLEYMAGLDRRRILPLYSTKRIRQNGQDNDTNYDVMLFADSYMSCHDPAITEAALHLLNTSGLKVKLISGSCCQRPAISHGLLDQAKSKGLKLFERIEGDLKKGLPLLICEPSCASALRDDIPDLLDDPCWSDYSSLIFLFEDYIAHHPEIKSQVKIKPGKYIFHGHCHQKALFTTRSMHEIFQNNEDVEFRELDTGCCGMAGSFGYEKDHYDLSEKIANMVLIPELQKAGTEYKVIANGFSCRHQIEHFSHHKAKHWLEYLIVP